MDSNIRHLLHLSAKENNQQNVEEAYTKLKKERQSSVNIDKPDAVSSDLYVLCAETAFKHGRLDIMENCIKMFFIKTPPSNQFLCRAYLCQAQLSAPTSSKNPEQLDKAVEYLLKAINFAKKNSRYYFLVYNASVLYWQFCRPFLKPNYRQYLAKSLHQVVKALDDIDDKDHEWRAQLMIALIECHVDAGRKEDATQISTATLAFTKSNVPTLYTTVLGLQVRHRLIDLTKVSKEAKASNELYIFYKIQRLRTLLEADEKVDLDQDLNKIYKAIVKGIDSMERASTAMSNSTTATSTSKTGSPYVVGSNDRIPLLVDLARLCLENDRPELASDCLGNIKGMVKDSGTLLEIEFMKCELAVKSLGEKKENYSKSVVEKRIQAIRKLEQYLMTAVRLGNPNVIQAGCVTTWNMALPLLQTNLRHHVRKPLTLVAQALEDIDSLLVLLRCQIHTELAKCEEDEDQLEYAVTHLTKALELNDAGQYRDRLESALKRLQLRATLYKTPERPEDLAAMIIEQARASDDSSTVRMKRASLVRAGEALSPDAFTHVLDSENETKDPSTGKGPPTALSKLAGRAAHFEKAVSKAVGHLKRLGDENDQERVRIWADLAKTARKQNVWDVARVASRFCLLYDDGRWSRTVGENKADKNGDAEGDLAGNKSPVPDKNVPAESQGKLDPTGMKLLYPEGMMPFTVEQDLMRILAEVQFIYAEALVHLLRKEGVQLGDKPIPPEDTVKLRPKRYGDQQVNFDEIPEWVTYCNWISSLSTEAIRGFQRAAAVGVELNEPWLVCNAAVYVWNYTTHMLSDGRHKQVIPIYGPILEDMKTTGHAGETALMCQMCDAVAKGYMQPWIPALSEPSAAATPSKEKAEKTDKAGKGRQSAKGGGKGGKSSKTGAQAVNVDPEAGNDLKLALEVIEFALNSTNGSEPKNLIPMSLRHPLIKTWTFCKQLLNQQIPKNLGHDDENPHGQGPMCRALCAVEMLSLQGNGLPEFTTCPGLMEVVKLVEGCLWSDRLVELEAWSRLAVLAFNADNHALVMHCGQQAVRFADSDQCLAKKQPKSPDNVFKHKLMVEQEMLFYASVVMGQSLMKNMQGKNEIRRDALVCFVNACRFGQKAGNYELVITAARHYWNSIKPFIGEPIERELLKEPLGAVLECIAAVAGKEMGKEDEEEEEETELSPEKVAPKKKKTATPAKQSREKQKDKTKDKDKKGKPDKSTDKKKDKAKDDKAKSGKGEKGEAEAKPKTAEEEKPALPSAYDEDLKLRAAMYGVLFQAYADKHEWEQGLRAMDQAVKDMPRTYHRLMIFKHRVITKAKLGRNVQFDMGKFKNETEDVISSMWRHVALNSKDPADQLSAYQNAIEALQSPESDLLKVDYLTEFGEWLFVNEFPVADALDQYLWAVDILLNNSSKTEVQGREDNDECDSDSEGERLPSKFVPVKQRSVIGVRPSDVSVRMADMFDVRQMETLMRIHVMLAQLSGRSSPHHNDYVLMAYAFLHRIWQVSICSAEKMQKDGGKPGERSPSRKGKDKGKDTRESQTRLDKPGSKSCLPNTMEAWSTLELPEKILEYFKCDITGTMVNKNTILKPELTVHYLYVLMTDLRDLGFHQLCLPVVALLQLIADTILEHAQFKRLVHLRAMELCQELNLVSGVTYQERMAGIAILNEQEQAKSREEIEMWQEKKRQVKAEEERTRNSRSSLVFELTSSSVPRAHAPGGTAGAAEDEPWNKHKRVLGGVCCREVWTEQAEVMIRQGHYRAARQLLFEANLSARAFDDKRTLSSILMNLAVLALAESNWGQATSLLVEAQKLQGDQKFWLDTTLLLAEAALLKTDKHSISLEKPDPHAKDKSRGILLQAKNMFQELAEENPNKANMADYIEAMIYARLGSLTLRGLLDNPKEREHSQAHKDLLVACKHLSRAKESLCQLGYHREAVKVMMKHAAVERVFAQDSDNTDERHERLLEALEILKEAVNIADATLHQAQSLSSLSELRNLSLPVQREAVEVKLMLCDLMVDMFVQFSEEERAKRQTEARRGSIQKLIDDFVRAEPPPGDKQRGWKESTRSLAEDTMTQLIVAHGQAGSIASLKSKTLLVLGRCLRALAAHTAPDAEIQWREVDLDEETRGQQTAAEREENEQVSDEVKLDQQPSREFLKHAHQALKLQVAFETSKKYISQAVECLTQSVQIGLRHGYRELVRTASYELMECIGTQDPSSSSQYLALFQSCHASSALEGVLRRAQLDPSVSRQAALLHQKELLACTDFLGEHTCTVAASNSSHLGDCEAWRRLSITKSHLELTREFSATSIQFVVLQHSPDRRHLYGAVLDKGRSAVPSGKANKQTGTLPVPSKALVARAAVNRADLERLLEEFSQFRSDTAAELLRRNYVRFQQQQHRKMLGRLDADAGTPHDQHQDVLADDPSVARKEAHLESHFQDIVAALEAYLDPVLTKLQPALGPDVVSETVVLLADEWLLRLPMEALKTFCVPKITSLSRDFSLQFHYHRVHTSEGSDYDSKSDKKGKKPEKTAKPEKPSTAKSKSDKKGGKEFGGGVPKDGPVIDVNGVRYIVDSFNECSEAGEDNPSKVMSDLVAKFKNYTAKWNGILGSDHLPSLGEFQRLLNESSLFIFYGTERCLGSLPPPMLAPANLTECHLVFLLDLVQTGQSFLRQGKDDATKSVSELCLEQPLEAAMLFSLAGVGCVLSNAWHVQLAANRKKISTCFTGLLEQNKTVGQSARAMVEFPKPPQPEPETDATSDLAPGSDGDKKDEEPSQEVGPRGDKSAKERNGSEPPLPPPPPRHWFNTVVYGTPTLLLNPAKG